MGGKNRDLAEYEDYKIIYDRDEDFAHMTGQMGWEWWNRKMYEDTSKGLYKGDANFWSPNIDIDTTKDVAEWNVEGGADTLKGDTLK